MLQHVRRARRIFISSLALALLSLALPVGGGIAAAHTAPSNGVIAKKGDRSEVVVQLQQQLLAAGITVKGGADGIFGSGTEAAVKAFQKAWGLPVNGVADVPTATLLGMVPATPVLSQGANGSAVQQMQQQLIKVGIAVKGGADGWFGSGTKAALTTWQSSRYLPATGSLDAASAAILANVAGAVPATLAPSAPAPSSTTFQFPVPKTCKFWDTYGAPRSGGRRHQGVDILAASGTPIYAVMTGTITKRQFDYKGSLAGNALWLTVADGTYYFYAHLNGFANGITAGSKVNAGTVIGYVGKTGNASGPHLHFEVHPKGGSPVNPYPIVRAVSGC